MPASTLSKHWAWDRDRRLLELGYANYDAYIASSRWVTTRARFYKERDATRCVVCREVNRIILHHVTYERVGAEDLDDLAPMCNSCHEFLHGLLRSGYIDSLDPQAVIALSDAERAEQQVEFGKAEKVRRAAEHEAARERFEAQPQLVQAAALQRLAAKRRRDIRSELRLVRYLTAQGRSIQAPLMGMRRKVGDPF